MRFILTAIALVCLSQAASANSMHDLGEPLYPFGPSGQMPSDVLNSNDPYYQWLKEQNDASNEQLQQALNTMLGIYEVENQTRRPIL